MARIQWHADDIDSFNPLTLKEANAVPGVDLSARIVGKAGQHLHLVPEPCELPRKGQPLERRFGIEPLGHKKDPHRSTSERHSATRSRPRPPAETRGGSDKPFRRPAALRTPLERSSSSRAESPTPRPLRFRRDPSQQGSLSRTLASR